MTDAELNKLLFQAYLFGQRVLYRSVDPPKVKAADDKSWDLLREIAEGETTLTEGAADMLLHTPVAEHRVDAIREYLARATPQVIRHDREMARRILEGALQFG